MRKRLTPGVVLGFIAVGFAMSGSAVAGSLITSAKIKDGTIQNKDIKKGTIALNRLTKGTQAAIAKAGKTGAAGAAGATGAATGRPARRVPPVPRARPSSPRRAPRDGRQLGLHQSQRDRRADRVPALGPADAPLGDGALNLTVRDGTEKVAYGNETDFVGDDFSAVDAVGFRVYTTGENTAKAPAGTPNMPGIIFEIDPNVTARRPTTRRRSSCPGTRRRTLEPYIDATTTGHWGLTGGLSRARRATSTARAAPSTS